MGTEKEKQKTEMTFVEKGDHIVWKRDVPNLELDSRQVLIEVDGIQKSINDAEAQIEQMNGQIELAKQNIIANIENLKKIKKFEEKMTTIQVSKAKAIYDEVKEKCLNKIESEYTHDEGLTPEQEKHQKFCLYQKAIATHERSAKELSPRIMKLMYYTKSIIENPF